MEILGGINGEQNNSRDSRGGDNNWGGPRGRTEESMRDRYENFGIGFEVGVFKLCPAFNKIGVLDPTLAFVRVLRTGKTVYLSISTDGEFSAFDEFIPNSHPLADSGKVAGERPFLEAVEIVYRPGTSLDTFS